MKKILLNVALIALSVGVNAQSWVKQATKFPDSFGVQELSIVDANTVWITAFDGRSTANGGGTYPKIVSKTVNGGATWTAYTISNIPSIALIGDIAGVDANTAFVVTASTTNTPSNGIWKTTNGGTNWVKQNVYGTQSFSNIVYFWDANNGFTAGDQVNGKHEMYKTSNGGATWTAVAGAPAVQTASEYGLTGMKDVKGDNIWIGTTTGRLLRSSDRGTTWISSATPIVSFGGGVDGGGADGSMGKMTFKDANNGILLGVDNSTDAVLYSTTNGGATWTPIDDIVGTWFFGDIEYVPGTANTYVSSGVNGNAPQGTGSSYSTDGGKTWKLIDNISGPEGGQRGKLGFLNASTGWCGFYGDAAGTEGIFKLNGNLSLAVSEAGLKSSLKVSPNPAVDVIKVTSDKEIKSVTIYDLSGKKVQSYKDASQVNVASLAKGTYVLQVYYGNNSVENTKLIKK